MNDENVNRGESSGAGEERTVQSKKPRSGRERIIVWSVIGILLIMLLLEARARFGYSMTLNTLNNYIYENGASGKRLTLKQFHKMASAAPSISTEENSTNSRVVSYVWKSVFKQFKIQLTVQSESGEDFIVTFATPGAPPEKVAPLAELTEEQKKLLEVGMAATTPGGGGGGGHEHGKKGKGGFGKKGKGKGGFGGRGSGQRRPGGNLLGKLSEESVQTELDLTDEQKQKIEELKEKYPIDRSFFQELREKSQDEREAVFEERRNNIEAELKKIFNEKQQEIWKNLSQNTDEKSSNPDSPK